ncbi:pseudouridine synthase [Phenylobacterium sp.]|uniref:pseudouridine synthase n=1 Tax=Phenylobacterium sp. TaxID=1871053 RepID=UPI003983302D
MVMVHDPHRTDGAPSGQARTSPKEPERVAKALARAGVASRRDVERLIEAGRVALNGKVLTTPAVKVAAGDILTVDGAVVSDAEPARLFRYHKPVGLVTTHKDPHDRPTVFQALPEGLPRLISVGRLDLSSEGLLLLTNDGGLARALELPGAGVARRYRARAHGRVTQDKLDTLKAGVTVEGVHYGAITATLDKAKEGPQGANVWITVTLAEGKNREVRRVLEFLGLKVNRLIRLSYGPLALGTLGSGQIEEVGPRVIREQFAQHIAPENLPTGERPQFRAAAAPTSRRAAAEAAPGRQLPGRRGKAAAEREGGAARAKRTFDQRSRPASKASGEPAPKKEYKAGWAKPKPKPKVHSPAKKPGAPRGRGPKPRG